MELAQLSLNWRFLSALAQNLRLKAHSWPRKQQLRKQSRYQDSAHSFQSYHMAFISSCFLSSHQDKTVVECRWSLSWTTYKIPPRKSLANLEIISHNHQLVLNSFFSAPDLTILNHTQYYFLREDWASFWSFAFELQAPHSPSTPPASWQIDSEKVSAPLSQWTRSVVLQSLLCFLSL